MALLWHILHFAFRLNLGILIAMAITSPRHVTSGFFRVHLWVAMGINSLAAMVVYMIGSDYVPEVRDQLLTQSILLTVGSYAGAVCWLYEKHKLGRIFIVLLAVLTGYTAWIATPEVNTLDIRQTLIECSDIITSSLAVGSIMTAMLLGHWYLNTPTMNLVPLRLLLKFAAIAILLRVITISIGEACLIMYQSELVNTQWWIFVGLRWLAGIIGTSIMLWMTWVTLRVPNTQSATGILYAATILVFIGELTAQILSDTGLYPL